jgi:antitoxin Phd
MNTMDATEAKNRFGTLLQDALVEPVGIRKNGRVTSVLLSIREYERLLALEDAFWGNQAKEAEEEGFLSAEESMRIIQSKIHEKTAPDA